MKKQLLATLLAAVLVPAIGYAANADTSMDAAKKHEEAGVYHEKAAVSHKSAAKAHKQKLTKEAKKHSNNAKEQADKAIKTGQSANAATETLQ